MNHHRPMILSIASLVPQIKSFREIVIDLNGSKLPLTSDNVFDNEINFRPIERCLSLFFGPIDPKFCSSRTACLFRSIPAFGLTDVFVSVWISESNTNTIIVHAKNGKDGLNQLDASHDFVCDLVFGNEQMGIILRESTDSGKS